MKEALFYKKLPGDKVICHLCPHNCIITPDKTGTCQVRYNKDGNLYTRIFNEVSAIHSDPIEKKPLYHFYPGRNILSIGGVGCNFKCPFCQNFSISQCFNDSKRNLIEISSEEIVDKALGTHNNIGIAYTYNEPFTFYEFMFECAELAHTNGLKNIVVSNGYVNEEPLKKILPFIDAFNIDLKAFNNEFYKKEAKGRLQPVLDTLKIISESGKHLEVTFLAITNVNDDEREFRDMVNWISKEIGKKTPLHISRYFPAFKSSNPATSVSTLENFYDIASKFLNYVFLGNINDIERSATYCPECKKAIIKRNRYSVNTELLINSKCFTCGSETGIKI